MLLIITLLLPLLGAALMPLFHFTKDRPRQLYVEAVVCLTSALVIFQLINRSTDAVTLFTMIDGLDITFRMDGMSCVFMGLVAILWPLASLYGFEYMHHEERPNTFFFWYTMTYGITLAVASSANLFTLYISFECLTLITLPLVTHKQDAQSNRAGRKYVYFSITGAAMAFVALIAIMYYGTSTNFQLGGVLDPEKIAGNEQLLRWIFLLGFVGFGTKAAIFPMSKWLPAASVAPTPVTALLHAVAVVNTGAFAVLRLIYYSFGADFLRGTVPQALAIILACVTIIYGSGMAVKERHFKRRLAYSTISNLSYMLMGAALMTSDGLTGSLSHMIFHGLMKITLFYCAGAVLVKTGREYVMDLRGLSKVMPFTCGVFTLASVALVGVPPLCGFVSKWNLLTAAAACPTWISVLCTATLIVSAILTAVYLFSVVFVMYFRPLNSDMVALEGKTCDPSWQMKLPLALLCAMMIFFGLYAQPLVSFLRGLSSGAIL